jgi:hypothetical protein
MRARLRKDEEDVKPLIVIAALTATMLATAVPAEAASPRERTLARQVKTLKAQNAALKAQSAQLGALLTDPRLRPACTARQRSGKAASR